MSNTERLPPEFVREGKAIAASGFLFGVPLDQLTHEEAIAAAAMGWKK